MAPQAAQRPEAREAPCLAAQASQIDPAEITEVWAVSLREEGPLACPRPAAASTCDGVSHSGRPSSEPVRGRVLFACTPTPNTAYGF